MTQARPASNDLFRRYFEFGLIGMAVTSPTKGWLEVNQRLCEMLGYTRDELYAMTWAELTHPDDLAADVSLFDRMLAGEIEHYDMEKRFLRKDGTVLMSHLFVTCMRAQDGSVEHVVAHIQDIGDRKHAEQQLRLQRDMTLALASANDIEEAAWLCVHTAVEATGADIGAMHLVKRPSGRLRMVYSEGASAAIIRELSTLDPGSAVQQLVMAGRPIYTGGGQLPEDVVNHLRTLYRSGGAVPILHDGSVIACLTVGSYSLPEMEDATRTVLESIAGIAGAVIARFQAEHALREREHQYRSLFETAQVGIFKSRLEDGMFLAVNPHGARLSGYDSPDEMVGKIKWSDFLVGDERVKIRELLQREGSVAEHQARWKLQDGRTLDMMLSAQVNLDSGTIEGIAIDVTELKLARAELEKAHAELERRVDERTSELETFAYSVSHDLRAPLRSIDGFSLALMEDHAERLDDEGLALLATVRRAAQRMGQLIDDLLGLSRAARAEMTLQMVSLSLVAEGILRHLREQEPEREVEISIHPVLVVEGDLRLLRISLENLIGNAWKYSSTRVPAHIEFGLAEDAAVATKVKPGTAVYFVRDNGVGFDMTYADKLFKPFQRLHTQDEFPGTGIGLATVHRIIRRHKGEIWVESEIDQGTTFFFTLQNR